MVEEKDDDNPILGYIILTMDLQKDPEKLDAFLQGVKEFIQNYGKEESNN